MKASDKDFQGMDRGIQGQGSEERKEPDPDPGLDLEADCREAMMYFMLGRVSILTLLYMILFTIKKTGHLRNIVCQT